jgi:hypothetical protein
MTAGIPSIRIPDEFPGLLKSADFLDEITRTQKDWVLDGIESRRHVIDAFISENLDNSNDPALHVLRDVKNLSISYNFEYYRLRDNVTCRSTKRAIDPRNVCLGCCSGDGSKATRAL